VKRVLRDISIRVKLAVWTGSIVAFVILGHSFQELVGEAIAIQEEIALETRLVLVGLAGAVGGLWTEDSVPDLEPFAERFKRRLELRTLALLSAEGEVVAHQGLRPTPQEIRMVTSLRLRAVPRTLWGLSMEPLELVIATPVLRGETLRGYLLCALRTEEPLHRLRERVARSVWEALLWVALGAGLTLWATRRLTHPLARLAENLLYLGRGSYELPQEGRADGEIGVVQDRLVALSGMLADERSQVSELTAELNHQINVISTGLEARAAELSAVLDSARDAVLVVRADGKVLRVNEPARQFFGADGKVLRVNEPARQFFGDTMSHPLWECVQDATALRRAIEHACATQSPVMVHTEVRRNSELNARPLRIRLAPLQRVADSLDALVVVAEDLTTTRQLNQLGNHLNAIKGYAALLERQIQGGDKRVRKDLESIAREVRAAGALLERTQELTRTRHAIRLEFTLAELLLGAKEMAALAASHNSVEIVLEVPEQDVSLRGDPELLGEALFNLVMNGIQAMPNGGELLLRAWQSGRRAVITVEDQGEGIPEDIRSRIFDPFFTTKPAGEGTGLGLAIADHIVGLHDGEINVTSEPGAGTRVEVLLPLQRGGVVHSAPDDAVFSNTEATS